MYRSPGIYLTAEDNPGKLLQGDRRVDGNTNHVQKISVLNVCWLEIVLIEQKNDLVTVIHI